MRRLTFLTLVASLSALPAFGHPHMSLDSRIAFELEGRTCNAIELEWVFDPVFSGTIIGQFDADRDGKFSAAENERVRAGAFSNLKNYGYFIFLRKGELRSSPASVEGFQASQRGGRLVYRFRVSLAGKGYSDDFSVAIFDTSFYCAVRYPEGPASARSASGGSASPQPRIEVAQNTKYPVYYNPAGAANDFRVYEKWEKGLATAYPEEIRVVFDR